MSTSPRRFALGRFRARLSQARVVATWRAIRASRWPATAFPEVQQPGNLVIGSMTRCDHHFPQCR